MRELGGRLVKELRETSGATTALAWLDFDRGNGRVGSRDGCGLALLSVG